MSIFQKFFSKKEEEILTAFADGQWVEASQIEDITFSKELMGKTMGIRPEGGLLSAPAAGRVVDVFHTHHAITMETELGVEILLHIGLNTVSLDGAPFTPLVSAGKRVKAGEGLIAFDKKAMAAAGCDTVVIMVISNSEDFSAITVSPCGRIKTGEPMMTVKI